MSQIWMECDERMWGMKWIKYLHKPVIGTCDQYESVCLRQVGYNR